MSSAVNALSMIRFGFFRFGGHGGAGIGLVLVGLVFAGVLIWALTRTPRSTT
jgi:hypothetical protein